MPLPDERYTGSWPPRALDRVTDRLAVWGAWYSGDPEDLSRVYGGYSDIRDPSSPFDRAGLLVNRPSQYRGGIVGTLARWFWGQPTPLGERRAKLHVPLAGDIASTSADLLFQEMPGLDVDDQATGDRLEQLAEEGLHAVLLEAAELAAALGGVYLRIAWDADVADHPWLLPAHADAAVPEWQWGKLAAVTFWRVLHGPDTPHATGGPVVRHLERHEPGVIYHGLYEGTADKLGRVVPLDEHEDTRQLAGIVDEESSVPTGVDRLTAVYVPNMKPARLWRADSATTNLGRSDYQGVEPAMDALDETWTSWMRDIRLGKARLIVPHAYLQSQGPGKGAVWEDREVFTGLDMLPKPDSSGNMISENQFKIRVEEHRSTARALVEEIIHGAGYATQTFAAGDEGQAATATEIHARERRSYTTRGRKIGYWRPALADAIETLLAIDRAVFRSKVRPARPRIEWPDAVADDQRTVAETLQALASADAASTETRVRMLHPDWDDDQVRGEVAAIAREQGTPLDVEPPDPDASRGTLADLLNADQG